ncbi:MAG: hypothetical protein BWY83_01213 [bacterium ADurb.Bin478]|nr:MAG: hypothetical protein BWY83_01213 [bacterium ADurb.Bin478]
MHCDGERIEQKQTVKSADGNHRHPEQTGGADQQADGAQKSQDLSSNGTEKQRQQQQNDRCGQQGQQGGDGC